VTFRARLQVAFGALAVFAVGGLGLAVKIQMTRRLTADYEQRVTTIVDVIHDDLGQERAQLGTRLHALARALADNRFRLAMTSPNAADRAYLLDYAATAMRLAGLTMLQIEDGAGRVLSSGNFRNDFDRTDSLPFLIGRSGEGVALATARRAEGKFLALVRADSTRLGSTLLYVVGGVEIDRPYLQRLARDADVTLTLTYPGDSITSREGGPASAIGRDLSLPFAGDSLGEARLVVHQSVAPLEALRASVDRWSLLAALIALAAGLILATFLSSPLSRPIAALADQMAELNLERLDGTFAGTARTDEVGTLARGLTDLSDRLRRGALQLRDAERRATTGDLSRQVNHDVKNGLVPIRNVLRHLAEVAETTPGELPQVFRERKQTLDQGVAYLEALAANYAKLSPTLDGGSANVASVVGDVVRGLPEDIAVRLAIAPSLPNVRADAVVLRRIIENVILNAADAVARRGAITIAADLAAGSVRIAVIDTGPGMTGPELERAFQDFYTSKAGGTGLGLSIVRRLITDLGGSLKASSEPGKGTQIEMVLPAAIGGPAA
jgi:signal transduction histidine kinase